MFIRDDTLKKIVVYYKLMVSGSTGGPSLNPLKVESQVISVSSLKSGKQEPMSLTFKPNIKYNLH